MKFLLILLVLPVLALAADPRQASDPADESNTRASQAIDVLKAESERLFDPEQFGYDLIVGSADTSALSLVSVASLDGHGTTGAIPYAFYEALSRKEAPAGGETDYRKLVKWAVPLLVADSYHGHRVLGTSALMFGCLDDGTPIKENAFELRKSHPFALAEGRIFAPRKFEATIGSEIAKSEHLKLGDKFRVTHGFPGADEAPDVHKPEWTVVGILKPTGTPSDRDLFIPIVSVYAIEEHMIGLSYQFMLRENFDATTHSAAENRAFLIKHNLDVDRLPSGMRRQLNLGELQSPGDNKELLQPGSPKPQKQDEEENAYVLDANGEIVPYLPPEAWKISAVLVKTRGGVSGEELGYGIRARSLGVRVINPATAVRESLEELREVFGQKH